jgi:uncharacterized protein
MTRRNTSKTAMLDVVKGWRWRELREALRDDAPLDHRDPRGRGWLHLCCGVDARRAGRVARDSIKTAQLLIDAGLDLHAAAFTEENFAATPLWYAISFGHNLPLAKHLLALGASPNHCLWAAAFNDDAAALRLLAQHGAPIDAVAEGATPLFFAVQWSRFTAVRTLLELGADPDWRDAKGRTALHCLLRKGAAPEQLRLLMKHGARVDLSDGDGRTAAAILRRKRDPAYRKLVGN